MLRRLYTTCIAGCLALLACSPTYDWREIHGNGVPFTVVLPAKPTSQTRPITLAGSQVTMTMTATEVENVTFAVGAAELPDVAKAADALAEMKAALLRNIGGTIRRENTMADGSSEIEADGTSGGSPRLLFARFIAKDKRVYQLVVVGKGKVLARETVDTFFTSFKPS